jgi:hypothetical protein
MPIEYKIDIEKVQLAAMLLGEQLENLDDFNGELQNTIANVYYRPFFVPDTPSLASDDFIGHYAEDAKFSVIAMNDLETIEDIVKSSRGARDQAKIADKSKVSESMAQALDGYLQQLLIDIYKYRIEDAPNKSPIRRAIERRFASPISEVDGLYSLMRQFL